MLTNLPEAVQFLVLAAEKLRQGFQQILAVSTSFSLFLFLSPTWGSLPTFP